LFPYWAPRRWVASNLNLLGGPWPYAEFRDRGSESCDWRTQSHSGISGGTHAVCVRKENPL